MNKNKTTSPPSNRQHVIETAAGLFLIRGYSYTSMDDVMRESQVSKSNIYYHFKSKEELLLAVVNYWAESYERSLFALLSRSELSVEERIMMFLDGLTEGIARRNGHGGCPFVTLYLQCPENAVPVRERIALFFTELQPMLVKLFRQGAAKGEFRQQLDPEQAAPLFIACLEGSLVLAETTKDLSVIETTVRGFCQMLH
ncbi:TetR/AcrR family transcriptional regulator [Paenibacillus oleatilyticus]|uniref:TetR/AcrR family transcriptional regulator n=1 Tax=Paenibacillus oleatilyticus TaxID=2594886 RepID=UPI001C1F3329|nr:TetR/AcrR family transcriptional regulator [Paenibacillus oleatilyticus]MBU7318770.1 TetR/AcrR family transcriptional regulator [Paenibacillus oleatilyticus]